MVERYKSQFMETFISELKSNMQIISNILEKNNIDFCFVGGATLIGYNYRRTTDDIDILVSKMNKNELMSLKGRCFKPAFQGAKRKFIWNNPQIKIDILFSGDEKKSLVFEEPKEISVIFNGVPVISLEKLIEHKLASGTFSSDRYKDLADVQELIRINKLHKNYGSNFREDLEQVYIKIWNDTAKE